MNMIYIFRNNTKDNFMERKKKKKKKTNSTGLVGSSKEEDRGKKT